MTSHSSRLLLLPLAVALLSGCAPQPEPLPLPEPLATAPDPIGVERVVFLVGDAGIADDRTHPLLRRLQQDVEYWAQRLPEDSAVMVIMLGDNVYPLGVHPPGSEEFDGDTAIIMDQVRIVGGEAARAKQAQLYFLAGNHDWGLKEDWEGFTRLLTLDDVLTTARETTGAGVRLVPQAGSGGPFVLDWGASLRIIFLDTSWWLLRADIPEKEQVLGGVAEAMRTAGSRRVIIAAHHPFKSVGPHGGAVSFWKTLGLQYILTRSGAILQDLTSTPYRRLANGLRAIFAEEGPPLLFVGGHEHSLQVIEATEPDDPRFMLVSGSASKVSGIGQAHGMHFGMAAPGYMTLVIERDGDIGLFVEAGQEEALVCPADGPDHETCMQEGVASIKTVYSQRVR